MKNGIRVTIMHDDSYDYYYMYSLTLGEHIGGMFDTKQDAIDAAENCGVTVVERSDLPSVKALVLDNHDYSVLLWWLEVCDFECVRTIFNEILYHEACIRNAKACGSDMNLVAACGMSARTHRPRPQPWLRIGGMGRTCKLEARQDARRGREDGVL